MCIRDSGHPAIEPLAAAVCCEAHRVDGTAFDKNALEACDAGITACDAAVAQTGSILVSSGHCGGRALSILPHVHVVIVSLDQIVATLGDALDLVRSRYAGRPPSTRIRSMSPVRLGPVMNESMLGSLPA